MKPFLFLAAALVVLAGCKRQPSVTPVATATNQTYAVRGVVQAIASDLTKATIHHQAISG